MSTSALGTWMPVYEVAARYARVIDAPVDRVWQAVEAAQPGRLPIVRWLFGLRRMSFKQETPRPILESLTRSGFLVLERREREEVVIGVVGRFWTFTSGIVRMPSPEAWRDYAEPGSARSAMCIHLSPLGATRTRVVTETRVQTFGSEAHRSFRRYWTFVAPFSGGIRKAWLAEIARLSGSGCRMATKIRSGVPRVC